MSEVVSRAEFAAVVNDLGDIKSLLGRMVEAMTKLALIDERQQGMLETNRKILDEVEGIKARQHQADIEAARNGDTSSRIETLEKAVRDQHVERQKDLARLGTLKWVVGGMAASAPVAMAVLVWAAKNGFLG